MSSHLGVLRALMGRDKSEEHNNQRPDQERHQVLLKVTSKRSTRNFIFHLTLLHKTPVPYFSYYDS